MPEPIPPLADFPSSYGIGDADAFFAARKAMFGSLSQPAVLYDRLAPAGVVVLDDFSWLADRAQNEAEQRWFAERGRHVLALATGQGLVIK